MRIGTWTLACTILTAAAAAAVDGPPPKAEPPAAGAPVAAALPDIMYMKSARMQIPITFVPEKRNELRDLLLYYSTDEGKSWKQAGRATPEMTAFPFTAEGDGTYWFSIVTIDKNNKREPADPMAFPPGLRVVIDTVKPLVRLTAERKGEEIVASWEVTEDHPDPSTFVLEYRPTDPPTSSWTPLPATPGATGKLPFRPGTAAAVTVQLRVKDRAENEGAAVAEVPGSGNSGGAALPPPPPSWTASAGSQNPPPARGTSEPPAAGQTGTTAASTVAPPALPPAGQPGNLRGGALPPLQLVNKDHVKLDFEVGNLGPSGLGSVDVYMTLDEGATWNLLAPEPGSLPTAGEGRGPGSVRGSVTVVVPEDGKVYGYSLVVKSKAGLGKPAPKSGDLPHIRIERDTVAPSATLNRPEADPTRRDTLVLTWKAHDKNLTATPITWEWAPTKTGPWSFIGTPELPNTGRYAWQVPADLPANVFLKLTVRDSAGNLSVAITPEAVPVDLSVPDVLNVNVAPR